MSSRPSREPPSASFWSKYGTNRLQQGDMPYSSIRTLYRYLGLEPCVRLLDLGSRYGRVLFYGALLAGHDSRPAQQGMQFGSGKSSSSTPLTFSAETLAASIDPKQTIMLL